MFSTFKNKKQKTILCLSYGFFFYIKTKNRYQKRLSHISLIFFLFGSLSIINFKIREMGVFKSN